MAISVRLLVLLLSSISVYPTGVDAVSPMWTRYVSGIKWLAMMARTANNIHRAKLLEAIEARLGRYAVEATQGVGLQLSDQQIFLTAVAVDRRFIDDWFGPKTSKRLETLIPELKRVWKTGHELPLNEVLHLYPRVPLKLHAENPQQYAELVSLTQTKIGITWHEFSEHVHLLLKRQMESDLQHIEDIVLAKSKKNVDSDIGDRLHAFLSAQQKEDGIKLRAAKPILTTWTLDRNSLIGVATSGKASLTQTRDLSKAIASSAGAAGALTAYRALEEFEYPLQKWAAHPCRENQAEQRTRIIGQVTGEIVRIRQLINDHGYVIRSRVRNRKHFIGDKDIKNAIIKGWVDKDWRKRLRLNSTNEGIILGDGLDVILGPTCDGRLLQVVCSARGDETVKIYFLNVLPQDTIDP